MNKFNYLLTVGIVLSSSFAHAENICGKIVNWYERGNEQVTVTLDSKREIPVDDWRGYAESTLTTAVATGITVCFRPNHSDGYRLTSVSK